MLEPLPLECTGSMVDPGEDHEVRLVHATGWCPLHECDCGTAEDQNLLDDQEELVDLHLDGEPFDRGGRMSPSAASASSSRARG